MTKYSRQADIVRQKYLNFPIIVIGVGGVGSWATLAMAKMGCTNIFAIDFDTIEEVNTPSQFYKDSQIGQTKVKALAENIWDNTGVNLKTASMTWEEAIPKTNYKRAVIVCALDSLEKRKELFKYLQKNGFPKLFIDSRMGGEFLRIFAFDRKNKAYIKKYEEKLFSNVKPYQLRCTEKAIVYNTFMCGSLIANFIKRFAKQEMIPFETDMDIPSLSILERG
jgi:molybdopterin/thiamine biosynthesis adenylyltransferase